MFAEWRAGFEVYAPVAICAELDAFGVDLVWAKGVDDHGLGEVALLEDFLDAVKLSHFWSPLVAS